MNLITKLAVTAALAASLGALPASATTTTTETHSYVGGGGVLILYPADGSAPGFTGDHCLGSGQLPSVGGACFNLPAGALSVSYAVADAQVAVTNSGWQFTDANATTLTYGATCANQSASIPVPAGAVRVDVFVGDVFNTATKCKNNRPGAAATSGTITATLVGP